MRFVTFNLRCDRQQDRENSFVHRQPLILRAIEREKPDVICFQEAEPHMAAWLKRNLDDYYLIGCGRGKTLDSEQMTVAFLKQKYQLLEMRTLWLSPTPAVPGSRYPGQSSCPRTCTDALLMEEESGRPFRVVNTHLDHVGAEAREQGLRQILSSAGKESFCPQAPMILAGDFNAEPDSEELRAVFSDPDLQVVTRSVGATYHGYGKADPPEQIDHIVLRGALRCTGVSKWTDEENGVYLSDHYPVCAEIAWAE